MRRLAIQPVARCSLPILLFVALLSCGDSGTGVQQQTPAVLQMFGGNNQEGVTGSELANPLMVEVLSDDGQPVSGEEVTWQVTEGDGLLDPATSMTNAAGVARSFLTLGTPGTVWVSASVRDLPVVRFKATARSRPVAQVTVFSGSAQLGDPGSALSQPVVARALDATGAPVAGATIAFTVTSGGGSVNPPSATTDNDGKASTIWTLGTSSSPQTLSATAAGAATSASFSATTRDASSREIIVVAGTDQQGVVSTTLANAITVRLEDAQHQPVAGATIQFTPVNGGQAIPSTATTDANGTAWTSWRLGTTAGAQVLRITSFGAASRDVGATAQPGAASQLHILSGNNQIAGMGEELPQPIVVRVTDAFGNPVPATSVTFQPATGAGSISPATGQTDAVGEMRARWTLGNATGSQSATAAVQGIGNATFSATATVPLHTLAHRVVDAEFDSVNTRIITVSSGPSRLHIIDPETRAVQSVDLPQVPTAVAVQPNGAYAAVGHDGWISYVNLQTRVVERVYPVTTDVLDIILPGNGWVYAFPRRDQWESIRSIQLSTGQEQLSGGWSIYAGTVGRLHPSGKYIYGADNGLSPSDFEKYDIRSGNAAVMYDSPYHGDYDFGGNVWISDDGSRLFARSGNTFRASEVQSEDMRYAGRLSGITYAQWIVQSTPLDRVYALPGVSWNTALVSEIRVYDSYFLAFKGVVPLPQFRVPDVGSFASEGRFIFVNRTGTRVYVLVRAVGEAGLANDWGLVRYSATELP